MMDVSYGERVLNKFLQLSEKQKADVHSYLDFILSTDQASRQSLPQPPSGCSRQVGEASE